MSASGALVPHPSPAALSAVEYFTPNQVDLIKSQVMPGATDDELSLFTHVCKSKRLDPFSRQIYAIKRRMKNERGDWIERWVFQTAIDGYRLIAERTGRYAPGREPTYTYEGGQPLKPGARPMSATAYVKKQTIDGTWHEVSATAHWTEYVAMGQNGPTKMWAEKGHVMLAKCAEALVLRRTFPEELSGLYTDAEMDRDSYQPPALAPVAASVAPPHDPVTGEVLPPRPAARQPPAQKALPPASDDECRCALPSCAHCGAKVLTDAQVKTLNIALSNAGLTDDEARYDYCATILKCAVESTKLLTYAQGNKVLLAARAARLNKPAVQAPKKQMRIETTPAYIPAGKVPL